MIAKGNTQTNRGKPGFMRLSSQIPAYTASPRLTSAWKAKPRYDHKSLLPLLFGKGDFSFMFFCYEFYHLQAIGGIFTRHAAFAIEINGGFDR